MGAEKDGTIVNLIFQILYFTWTLPVLDHASNRWCRDVRLRLQLLVATATATATAAT
jgi:hypothetical protein